MRGLLGVPSGSFHMFGQAGSEPGPTGRCCRAFPQLEEGWSVTGGLAATWAVFHGKILGNSLENHGKTMGKSWENLGIVHGVSAW